MRMSTARLLVGAALALVACKPSQPAKPPGSVAAAAKTRPGLAADAAPVRDWSEVWEIKSTKFADLVPANSPFVLVNEGPLPDVALDTLEPFVTPILAAAHDGMREDRDKVTQQLLDEIGPTLDGDDLRRLGFDPNPKVLVYLYGLAPVFRISLSDPAEIDALLRSDPGDELQLRNFHGQEFWEMPSTSEEGDGVPLSGALAINGGDLVLTVFPLGFEEELLPRVFGQELPAQRLWDTGFIDRAEQDFGLLPHYLVRLNLQEVMALGTGRAGGTSQAIAAAMDLEIDDECPEDLLRVAESAPTLYLGVRKFGRRSLDAAAALDIDDQSAAALAKLAGPIPGIGPKAGRNEVVAAGIGFNLAGLGPLLELWGHAVRQRPFTCESTSGLNGLADASAALQAIPADLRNFTGISVVAHDLEQVKDGTARGYVVVGLEDPLEAVSGTIGQELGILPDQIKRRRITTLADAAPDAAINDVLAQAKATRGARGIAIGSKTTPNAALLGAVDRRRPNDGTMMLVRWNVEQAYAAYVKSGEFDELDPIVRDLTEAVLSSLLQGSVALRANESGLVLDVSLARPKGGSQTRK